MKLKWQQAPVKTQWGDDMVVASVAIDKDHTVCFYCERGQTTKVEAMFAQRKPLTDEQRVDLLARFEAHKHEWHASAILIDMVEAAHGITGDK